MINDGSARDFALSQEANDRDGAVFVRKTSSPLLHLLTRSRFATDALSHVPAEMRRNLVFWLGIVVLTIPTLIAVARDGWSGEHGAHAPIVLATGIWVVTGIAAKAREVARPAPTWITVVLLVPCLALYAVARITSLVEVEGLAVYCLLAVILYSVGGVPVLRVLWFPLVYFLFLIPIPQSLIDVLTQPLKISISHAAVSFLASFGYPVAVSGVTIYINQFELLVAAACAGLNSLISLTAIGIFYVYVSHKADWRYTALLMVAVVPVAILANFARVVILVLLTNYLGDAAAQGFLHEFAGLTMFMVAVLSIFALDKAASSIRNLLTPPSVAT